MKKNYKVRLLSLLTALTMLLGSTAALADTASDAQATAAAETTTDTASEQPTAEAPAAEPTADARPAVDSSIVATLGDVQITAEEAAGLYSYVLETYGYYGYDVTESAINASLRDITLDAIISARVQQAMEAELGYDQFTDEEKATFQSDAEAIFAETYASVYESMDDGEASKEEINAKVDAELAKYDYTIEALVEQAQSDAAYKKLYDHLTAEVTVSDDDVTANYSETVAGDKALYENDLAGYTNQCMYGARPAYTPEGIRTVKHILIKYLDEDAQAISELTALDEKPDDYDAQYEALKQTAYANIKAKVDEIMAKIAAGEDFDALVAEYGEDSGMQSEPYKSEGYMVFDGCTNLVAEFVDSAMALDKVGAVTAEPALTTYGAHIMLYYSDLTPGEVELTDEKKEEIRTKLLTDKQSSAFNDAVNARKEEMGAVYKYPENLIELSTGEAAEDVAADAAADDTLVVEPGEATAEPTEAPATEG